MTDPFECKKHGLRQLSESGEWVLSLKLHPQELPMDVMTAPMGQRFGLAMVAIADDETEKVIDHKASQKAALLCENELFKRFLETKWGSAKGAVKTAEQAAYILRSITHVNTRANYDKDGPGRANWERLLSEYEVWKVG